MFSLTKEEKLVLLILGLVLLLGTGLNFIFKKTPALKDIVNLMDSQAIYPKVDLNQVSYVQLLKIPYVGPVTAKNIIDYRRENGQFSSLEQLLSVPGINVGRFKKISPYLKVRHR